MSYVKAIAGKLKQLREGAGFSREQVEQRLALGPGWIEGVETGKVVPTIDVLVAILSVLGKSLSDLDRGDTARSDPPAIARDFYALRERDSLVIHFRYAKHDATYRIPRASMEQFDRVVGVLRDGLAKLRSTSDDDSEQSKAIKTDSVARMFLEATRVWPHANPSDLWWFLVYRAYCDPFNHPVEHARLDHQQSWKRTGGWALEEVLVRHYGPSLAQQGIRLFIAAGEEKKRILGTVKLTERLEVDKVDVLLIGRHGAREIFFGVVHVKASFAERRTDDVPLSKALRQSGFASPLWTMDCKSTPSAEPVNRGELGLIRGGGGDDPRSAKRKDIEEDGYFSACFSYNTNTLRTPPDAKVAARVYVCNFSNPDDAFSRFVRDQWEAFKAKLR